MMDYTSIDVPRGSLEEAIAGTRKGERWEDAEFWTLMIDEGRVMSRNMERWICHPALVGWRRVVEPMRCLRCDTPMPGPHETTYGRWTNGPCSTCGLMESVSYLTESAAREAWGKIGGKR